MQRQSLRASSAQQRFEHLLDGGTRSVLEGLKALVDLARGPVNPSGRPAAAKVAAISSISPVQRQARGATAAAVPASRPVTPGCDSSHSANRSSATPSADARAATAASRALLPLVQAA